MKDVKFVIRFWGIPVKFIRKIPVTMADLTEKQYLSLVKYMNGQIREHRLITIMYNLPFFLFFTISRKKFWTYKLVESMETFSDFSGVECFSGSIVEAQAAGYDFDLDFYPVTEGKADKKSVKGSTLLKEDDLKVLIVKANSDLIVPGKIVYVSADGTEVTSEKQVNVTQKKQDTDEAVLVYVLYQ